MKLSKYVALAKRESFCRVIHVEGSGVWLGLRGAFYRATELPDVRGGPGMGPGKPCGLRSLRS